MMCYTISNFDIFSLKELNVYEIFMKFLKNVSTYLWVLGGWELNNLKTQKYSKENVDIWEDIFELSL